MILHENCESKSGENSAISLAVAFEKSKRCGEAMSRPDSYKVKVKH